MSDLDPEEEAVLETARRALTPPELVTRRMRAALVAKLAAPGVIAASSAAAASGAAVASGSAVATSAAVSSTAVSSTAAVSGSAVATSAAISGSAAPLAAVAGSALASGTQIAASAVFLKAALGVATAAVLATATSPYWLPATTGTRPSSPAATPAHVAPGNVAPAPARPLARRAAPVTQAATAASPAAPSRETVAAPQRSTAEAAANATPTPSHDAPAVKLQGELDGLRHAQQALQGGQPRRALELLSQLDAEYPASSLWQEREVARVLALCGVGRAAAARQIAQRVLAASPNSLYASRIQASCAGPSTQPKAPAPASVESPGKSTNSAPPVARFGDSGN